CQTRLEEAFGGIGAIAIVALFMTLAHNQYHHLNAIDAGTIVAVVPIMLAAGYLYWRTRSLLPSMVLHMAINVPTKGTGVFLLPALMVIAVILFRRRLAGMVQEFCRLTAAPEWKRAAVPA